MTEPVRVIGAGLAGSEAAWQLLRRGIPVSLYEMKPKKLSPAHKSAGFAELVCSNSLRSDRLENAVGLLKEEMRLLDSLVMRAADQARVPAGGALAVDRDRFSGLITDTLRNHPLCTVVEEEITELPEMGITIVATGPLTSDALAESICRLPGVSTLSFYDAAAPIVTADSLDMEHVFRASRYGRGDDYLNCPLTKEEYDAFIDALLSAETAPVHGFEETQVFEGCMPIESMARRGRMVPAFGPMKPVGLIDPRTGREPYACLQLRQDDAANTLYNLVGFQTRLKFPEQKRVFGLIPGLQNAEYARYGVMHRNTFLSSPGLLNNTYRMIPRPDLFFAGQMTGVEGYVESASSGLLAGINAARAMTGREPIVFPEETAIGALAAYISRPNRNFQPMNVTFGLLPPIEQRIRDKKKRYLAVSERALDQVREIAENCDT
ncbi:MAG: methylenetetrahydrofolate--tRNA-(uracil(54)-C(5))-methyltransferase (FADH(2)-oxidizing) TrmFO [Oscillospiraceae bacterium]|nr:methylenetetrahydrofolate--tRNA-(uracil(54)-C(5))-methyltransferase (FADH(2)-oxidizing) TrmFO [Oscillospiraceae bacterium]